MTSEERRQFVLDHRTAIFGYGRAHDGPAMSIVYYSADEEEILVSTMAERAKAKAVARNPKVSVCVLDEQWPPSYLQVYCDATIDTDFDSVVDTMMSIACVMAGVPMSNDVRPMVEEGARAEQRVALRLRPCATFYTPPHPATSTARPTSTPTSPTKRAPRSPGDPALHRTRRNFRNVAWLVRS